MTLTEASASYQSSVSILRSKAKAFGLAQATYDKIVTEGKAALESARSDYNATVALVSAAKTELELAIKAETSDLISSDDKPVTVVR